MRTHIWLALLLGGLLLSSACLADITLVENGAAKATIVVAKEALDAKYGANSGDPKTELAPNKIAMAAHDLQLYLEKMSGAKLPIVGDDTAPAGSLILVGRGALTKEFDAKIPSGQTPDREEEGYVIITRGNRLLLAGNDEPVYHGTEYAVYAFLNSLGVRWYMPGDFGDFVPKSATIKTGDRNSLSKPDFKLRNWWWTQSAEQAALEYRWKIRNGANPAGNIIAIPGDSSVRSVLPPPSEVNNPKYAKVFGKTATGEPHPYMPNLSSQESVDYVANVVKDYFRKNPDAPGYGIAPDDGAPVDFTPETMKRNLGMVDIGGRLGVVAELNTTDEWMTWIQKVAAEVYKEFPDRYVSTNGYANRNVPPVSVTPDPKVWIMFAAIWSDTMHAYDNPLSWQTLRQGQMLEQWAKMYKNVYLYNYLYFMLAGCGAPIPLAHKHAHDMLLYKQWGVIGFEDEGRTVRGESGIFPTYLRTRMMWDTKLDMKKEMNEFFTNWYGPAAAPAMAFWEDLENTFETTPWLGHEDRILPYVYSPALLDRLEKDIVQAETLAKGNDLASKHVVADRATLEHLKAYMAMNRAEFEANFLEAAKQAQRMLDVRAPATALSHSYFDPRPDGDSWGYYYWGSVSRRNYYQKVADAVTGKTGEMVVILPEKAKCKLDPRDDGRYDLWSAPGLKDDDWTTVLTTMPFYRQVAGGCDAQGYPYLGALWYRMAFDAPASAKGKKVYLYCAAIEPEAWVWVNGKYIGHREYHEPYERPNALDVDISSALVPGKKNAIAIRVHTGTGAAAQPDGLVSRLFLYSPKEKPISEQP